MQKLIFLLTASLFFTSSFATNFYFTGNEDTEYTNEANWSPSFPGREIAAGDKVYVQADIDLNGFDVRVKGLLDVSLGATISSKENGFVIENEGVLVNNGEIHVAKIVSAGRLDNSAAAQMVATNCTIQNGGVFNNMMGAKFSSNSLTNEATVNNYSVFTTEQFVNKANVNLYANAILNVNGTLDTFANSNIQKTGKATLTANHTHTTGTSFSSMMN
jgi:hypothetical protein